MSIIKAFREESEVIKFDNLFTRDLEDEQQFDLVFAAEQDDEDLKTIAGNKIMRENGEEKEFDLPDCVYVNEDGEVKDKDDEVEDISSNDADSDGVDDDIEAASDNPIAAAPSVVVNVDADDVNINAGNGGTSLEGTEDEEVKEDASVTVNAKVVNMTTNVDPANDDEVKAPSTEPATTPVPAEGPSDDEPIEPVGDVDIDSDDTPAEPESSEADVEECSDNTGTTPGTNDDGAPMGEGVEQIMTSSQLEDILNTGLDVAPAYEGGHFSDSPEDKSTEVVFSNSNDKEVREAALNEAQFSFFPKFKDSKELKKYSNLAKEADDLLNDQGEVSKAKVEKIFGLALKIVKIIVNIGSIFTTAESFMMIGIIPNLVLRGIAYAIELGEEALAESQVRTIKTQLVNIANNSKDSKVKSKINDEITKIDKGIKSIRSNKNEAAEPTNNDTVVKEEIEAVKNDDNLDNSKKIEGEFEDDLTPITDGDIEKILNNAPEDETKKDEGIDPVKPSDVPMNDGSAHEAAEPTKNDIEFIKEEDIELCCDPTEGYAPCPDCNKEAKTVPAPNKDSSNYNPYDKEPIEDKEDGMEIIEDIDLDILGFGEAESMDPKEDYVQADAETSLESIGPGITSGNLEKMYVDKDVDPNRKNSSGIEEAAEPTKNYIEFIKEDDSEDSNNSNDSNNEEKESSNGYDENKNEAKEPTNNDTVVKEEIEAVKNDDNLDNSKKIEGEFKDDLTPITDGDIEKILNNAPEDETKKDEGIDPVKPSDVPMNDGSAHEAAEPTKNDIEFIKEEDTDILDSDDIDMDNNCDISPVGPTKVIPDEVNAPVGDMNYDKEDALMKEESDFMDQINAIDNGDSFADTMNIGLNISPEEVLPGSDEELIDDEAIAFIEGE